MEIVEALDNTNSNAKTEIPGEVQVVIPDLDHSICKTTSGDIVIKQGEGVGLANIGA